METKKAKATTRLTETNTRDPGYECSVTSNIVYYKIIVRKKI